MQINKIYNEDCLETMAKMPNDFVDLVVTSPPYDDMRDYNGYTFDFEKIAKELFRVIKKGGVVVWIMKDQTINGSESGTSFKQALFFKQVGFNLHDTMIWMKDSFSMPSSNRYQDNFEYMFILSKGKPKTINLISDRKNKYFGTKIHGTTRQKDGSTKRNSNHNKSEVSEFGIRFNVWNMPTEKNSKQFNHPAMFPEKIAIDHIRSWSNENDIVFDCFMGSGTTAVASFKLKRKFIGCDLSKEYVKTANKRLKPYLAQTTLF